MKKMRKLIPAFAMLLVSAIMMSTASFAWFTMNDQVQATGMQVQAKASGNLLISENPMTATAKDIKVDFGGAKKDISPITFDQNDWKIPGGEVDAIYGDTATLVAADDDDVNADHDDNPYFLEYVVYLATAGDAFSGTLQFDFNEIANTTETIAPAYTLALYLEGADGKVDYNAPIAQYNVKDMRAHEREEGTTGFVDTHVTVNIPSTYGKTQSNAVGLKVVIRIYVDGALQMPGVTETVNYIIPVAGIAAAGTDNANTSVNEAEAIAEITKYDHATMSGYTFYTDLAGTAVYTFTEAQNGISFAEVGVLAYDKGIDNVIKHPEATYVNNTTVPTAGTSFSIDFRVEKTANQAPSGDQNP